MGLYAECAQLLAQQYDKTRPGVLIYFDLIPQLQEYSSQEVGELFLAILEYAQDGTETEFHDRGMRVIWRELVKKVDRDGDTWAKSALCSIYANYCKEFKKKFGEQAPPDQETWIKLELKKLPPGDPPLPPGDPPLPPGDPLQRQQQLSSPSFNDTLQYSGAGARGNSKGDERGSEKGEDVSVNSWDDVIRTVERSKVEKFEELRQAKIAILDKVIS